MGSEFEEFVAAMEQFIEIVKNTYIAPNSKFVLLRLLIFFFCRLWVAFGSSFAYVFFSDVIATTLQTTRGALGRAYLVYYNHPGVMLG